MIRYAKIFEIDDHQFLLRLCHHRALANLPSSPDDLLCTLLTIDTVTPVADEAEPHLMRLVVNCQTPYWQQRCFDAFNEAHCLEVLGVLRRQQSGAMTRAEIMAATQQLQDSLLAQLGR